MNMRETGMAGADSPETERDRLVAMTMRLIEQRGSGMTRQDLILASGLPRARIEALFPDEESLFDATVEVWFADHVTIMEEVVESDLPPNRKIYEFFARRFVLNRERYRADPAAFKVYCELGSMHFDRVRSYVDLADHYLCELIAQAQADGAFEGLAIDEALSLINQMVVPYTLSDILTFMEHRLSEEKLARIVDTMFAGLSAKDGGARGVTGLRVASGTT